MDETAFPHGKRVEFGRRRVAPRVCIIDSKPYIRTFLAETFEDLGFISTQHADAADMTPVLGEITPDLVLLAIAGGDTNAEDVLKTLATTAFRGNVILLGAPDSPALVELQRLGKRSGLPMLPALTTPFRTKELAEKLAGLLPVTTTRSMPVDLVDALDNNWLELHYQPLVDPRSLTVCAGEGVIRVHHPTWGVALPDRYIGCENDPHFGALSDFVLARAMSDWRYFAADNRPIEISVALPAAVLDDPDLVDRARHCLPDHPAFRRLVVAIDGTGLVGDLARVQRIARKLSRHNIGISLGNMDVAWPSLAAFDSFPLVEIKVSRAFVHGSAGDRLKRAACATMLDFCRRLGVRAVAAGVDTGADLAAMREAGFDLVQGALFGKPMKARKFARTLRTLERTLPS